MSSENQKHQSDLIKLQRMRRKKLGQVKNHVWIKKPVSLIFDLNPLPNPLFALFGDTTSKYNICRRMILSLPRVTEVTMHDL